MSRTRLDWQTDDSELTFTARTRRCILTVRTARPLPGAPSPVKPWNWTAAWGTRRGYVSLGNGDARSRIDAQRQAERCVVVAVMHEYSYLKGRRLLGAGSGHGNGAAAEDTQANEVQVS